MYYLLSWRLSSSAAFLNSRLVPAAARMWSDLVVMVVVVANTITAIAAMCKNTTQEYCGERRNKEGLGDWGTKRNVPEWLAMKGKCTKEQRMG
ncbi:hypothetical protein E2C01_070031 [Portunus trituberculatus]|uniref:Uncharacterized protein n=1 Tax=Portunus trituberculatus TaxID=210409 RepID=A0A5B7I432_PORTR|nr:hypothetical protein [Portunus trituberculatus]